MLHIWPYMCKSFCEGFADGIANTKPGVQYRNSCTIYTQACTTTNQTMNRDHVHASGKTIKPVKHAVAPQMGPFEVLVCMNHPGDPQFNPQLKLLPTSSQPAFSFEVGMGEEVCKLLAHCVLVTVPGLWL